MAEVQDMPQAPSSPLPPSDSLLSSTSLPSSSSMPSSGTLPPSTSKKSQEEIRALHDHNYAITQSPVTLKRRINEVVEQLDVMRKKLHAKSSQKSRIKKKVDSLLPVIDDLKNQRLISSDLASSLEQNFSGVTKDILARGLPKKGKSTVYPEEIRSFALTLQFYSNKAYKYVREAFDLLLPHPRQLRRWYSKIEG